MSRFLYFDCPSGISGDMILAAFLNKLVPPDYFLNEIHKLPLSQSVDIQLKSTERHAIRATRILIQSKEPRHHHRYLKHILKIIEGSKLSEFVKKNSAAVFTRLAEVEGQIHGVSPEEIHFHEVGAVDSIMDIVGAFICLDYLKPKEIFTSPLPVSRGVISSAHGKIPIPAPATLSLLQNFPTVYVDIEAELVTPTGAAVLTHIARKKLPEDRAFVIQRVGYGAGSRELKELPNLLRIWEGEFSEKILTEKVIQIDTNVDDMNPEIFPYLTEKLFAAGVLDVSLYPNIMKKGRPGMLISILCEEEKLPAVREILFRETTTLGFRYFVVNREKLPRQEKTIQTPWGKIAVKMVQKGADWEWLPEYESCKKIAASENIPLIQAYKLLTDYLQKKGK